MAHSTVVFEVEARLANYWFDTPIVGANTIGVTPADGSPYVLVDYPASNTRRLSMDTRLYREEGGFRVILHAVRGIGLATGLAQSEYLASIFRDRKFGPLLSLNTLAPDPPITDDLSDEGGYFLFITIVPYVFDYRGGDILTPAIYSDADTFFTHTAS